MAIIKCPECGEKISDKAPACIHCGFPLSLLKQEERKESPLEIRPSSKLSEEKQMCINCGSRVSVSYSQCPNCGLNFLTGDVPVKKSKAAEANPMEDTHLIDCPGCGRKVSEKAKVCPFCGEPIDTNVYCPKCGSSNTKVITGASKVTSVVLWGPFAAHKVLSKYICKECGHKF